MPRILPRAQHPISRSLLTPNTLKVLYRLHHAGFLAYLVGGAVRDLLLGRRPKDFDVGTNARPQQVRQLFRNARIVGRRFRIARVQFPNEVVEVSTFRRNPVEEDPNEEEPADPLAPEAADEDAYGTPEEDAFRRDFTVNGLFYNIADFTVIDYVGGLQDLERRLIRSIGPAAERFVEDPVRMLRAVEYSVRLGFALEGQTAAAIREQYREIRRASPARLAYELTESLKSGHAAGIFHQLWEFGLLPEILPFFLSYEADQLRLLFRLLAAADLLASRRKLSEEALLALVLWPHLDRSLREAANGERPLGALEGELKQRVGELAQLLAFSHFRGHLIRYGFLYLARLYREPRSPRKAVRILRHEAFPVALDLLALQAVDEPEAARTLARWQEMQRRLEAGQPPLVVAQASGSRRRRSRGRRVQA
ncbi:MAG: polynucleotide adenylyltransferase PcnB [Thermoanaerobaculum sp.]|nr:polynucleotide adenylyltransferase PcnB [Thermoanaerobaculum sp.]MDW7966738.1 polynucleotide adenylyltransferase PcnB [Thermoanaerobaculum sp.]